MASIRIARGFSQQLTPSIPGIDVAGFNDFRATPVDGELYFDKYDDKLYIKKVSETDSSNMVAILLNPDLDPGLLKALSYVGSWTYKENSDGTVALPAADQKVGNVYVYETVEGEIDEVFSHGSTAVQPGAWIIVTAITDSNVDSTGVATGTATEWKIINNYQKATTLPRGKAGIVPTYTNYGAPSGGITSSMPTDDHITRIEEFVNEMAVSKLELVPGIPTKRGQIALVPSDSAPGYPSDSLQGDLVYLTGTPAVLTRLPLTEINASLESIGTGDNVVGIEQTFTTVREALNALNHGKADLEGGKVKLSQMPQTVVGGMQYTGTLSATLPGITIHNALIASGITGISPGDYFIVAGTNGPDNSIPYIALNGTVNPDVFDETTAHPGDWIVFEGLTGTPDPTTGKYPLDEQIFESAKKIDNTDQLKGIKVQDDPAILRNIPEFRVASDGTVTLSVAQEGEEGIIYTVDSSALDARVSVEETNVGHLQQALVGLNLDDDVGAIDVNADIFQNLGAQNVVASLRQVRDLLGLHPDSNADPSGGGVQAWIDAAVAAALPAGKDQLVVATDVDGDTVSYGTLKYITASSAKALVAGDTVPFNRAAGAGPVDDLPNTNSIVVADDQSSGDIVDLTSLEITATSISRNTYVADSSSAEVVKESTVIDFNNRTVFGYNVDYGVGDSGGANSLVNKAAATTLINDILEKAIIDGGNYTSIATP